MCVCACMHARVCVCVCVFVHAHIYYGVQEYTYLTREIWRHASLGKIWVYRLYNVAFEAIFRPFKVNFNTQMGPYSIVICIAVGMFLGWKLGSWEWKLPPTHWIEPCYNGLVFKLYRTITNSDVRFHTSGTPKVVHVCGHSINMYTVSIFWQVLATYMQFCVHMIQPKITACPCMIMGFKETPFFFSWLRP